MIHDGLDLFGVLLMCLVLDASFDFLLNFVNFLLLLLFLEHIGRQCLKKSANTYAQHLNNHQISMYFNCLWQSGEVSISIGSNGKDSSKYSILLLLRTFFGSRQQIL